MPTTKHRIEIGYSEKAAAIKFCAWLTDQGHEAKPVDNVQCSFIDGEPTLLGSRASEILTELWMAYNDERTTRASSVPIAVGDTISIRTDDMKIIAP